MGDVGAERIVDHDAAEMRGRSGAGRAELHRRFILLGVGDEALHVGNGKILVDDQHQRQFGHQRHRRKIVGCMIERLFIKRLVLGMGTNGAEQEAVAIRGCFRHARRAEHAAGTADILHDNGLPEDLAHALRHGAAEHVGRSAGGEGDNQRDGPAGISLRHRGAGPTKTNRQQARNEGFSHGRFLFPRLIIFWAPNGMP